MPAMIPLYERANAQYAGRPTRPAGANVGLWYDKFPSWDASRQGGRAVEKLRWIKTVTGAPVGDADLIASLADRQRKLAEAIGGSVLKLTNESRFVSGLGREHPVENGFAWHHTLGAPYLPGSSLKGMVRAWARDDGAKAEADEILGSPRAGVGRVVLLDMLPAKPVRLVADIMTPHYGPYYQHGHAPGDWYSPIPIPFLVCEAGAAWQLAILPGSRRAHGTGAIDVVAGWLLAALEWQGAGGKTAVGYGRFARMGDV